MITLLSIVFYVVEASSNRVDSSLFKYEKKTKQKKGWTSLCHKLQPN